MKDGKEWDSDHLQMGFRGITEHGIRMGYCHEWAYSGILLNMASWKILCVGHRWHEVLAIPQYSPVLNGQFQDPKMELPGTIFLAICCGYLP